MPQTVEPMLQTVERMPQTVERMMQTVERMPQTVERMPQTVERMPQTVERIVFNRHASVPIDDESAAIAGRLQMPWESQGKVTGPHDTPISAIALQHEWTL